MSKAKSDRSDGTYTIEGAVTESGGLRVRDTASGATYEISEIDDETARTYIETLGAGSTVRLEVVAERDGGPTMITGVLPASMLRRYGTVEPRGM